MRHYYPILTLISILFTPWHAMGQISIDQVETPDEKIVFQNQFRPVDAHTPYFSPARYRAERAAIRKERNYLEYGGGLQGTLSSYNGPWVTVSGGDNAIALVYSLYLHHIFTKNRFTVETKFNANLGHNRMKVEFTGQGPNGDQTYRRGIWFKNQDEFAVSVAPSFKMSEHWSYGAIFRFRSQFANGYLSRTEQEHVHLKSSFMTPAYLDISLGFTYKSPGKKFPIVVNLSPLALSATYAESDWIRRRQVDAANNELKPAYSYGIEDPDKTSKYEGGSSVQIDFDRTFGKTEFLRYRTTLFGFYGWITDIGQKNKIGNYARYRDEYTKWEATAQDIKDKPRLPIHPTVRWENTIDIKATKYLTTTLSFQLYYNRAQELDIQTRTLLSVGLTYTFKNKPNP